MEITITRRSGVKAYLANTIYSTIDDHELSERSSVSIEFDIVHERKVKWDIFVNDTEHFNHFQVCVTEEVGFNDYLEAIERHIRKSLDLAFDYLESK